MTPLTPYLIRAYHEWIVDNNCTPYMVVDTYQPDVQVPAAFIQPDGQITLNVSPQATGNLCLGEMAVEFNARFSGQVHHIYVPCSAVLAIFAKENGQGTGFAVTPVAQSELENQEQQSAEMELVEQSESSEPAAKSVEAPQKKRGSHLRVVK